jgi:hypothetical protein
MRFEEIHISAISPDFVEEQPPEVRVSNATLEQRNRFRFCKVAFELINQRLLSVKIEGVFKQTRDYEFNIGILDPEPKRSVSISSIFQSINESEAGVIGESISRFSESVHEWF